MIRVIGKNAINYVRQGRTKYISNNKDFFNQSNLLKIYDVKKM